MSATLRLRNALVRDGSPGGSRVTSGLSSVGPPPTLKINQPVWNFKMTGSRSFTTSAPNTSRHHSREISWSRTMRKWVMITPSHEGYQDVDHRGRKHGDEDRRGDHREKKACGCGLFSSESFASRAHSATSARPVAFTSSSRMSRIVVIMMPILDP